MVKWLILKTMKDGLNRNKVIIFFFFLLFFFFLKSIVTVTVSACFGQCQMDMYTFWDKKMLFNFLFGEETRLSKMI